MRQKLLIALIAILAGALAATLFWPDGPQRKADRWLPEGGDFQLATAAGPLTLEALRGKAVLLYFGYTHCPDVCPTSLAVVAQALRDLEPAELERVRALFVSVDPQRDTPALLSTYAGYFHPNVLGATGERAALDDMVRRYGAVYRLGEKEADGSYAVDHSSYTYLVGPEGELQEVLRHGTDAATMRERVRAVLGG